MDKKPKVEIQVKHDHVEKSQKLTFSTQSREAARIRIDEEKKRKERIPFQVLPFNRPTITMSSAPPTSTIYQKLFEPSNVIEEKYEEKIDIAETGDSTEFILPQENETEEKREEDYPYFPGIYPSLYRPEESMYHERDWQPRKDQLETKEDRYLDLGPIDPENESKNIESEKVHNVSRILYTDANDRTVRSIDRSRVREGLKLTLSIMGAIGLGSLFGYLLLLFVLSGDGLGVPKGQSQLDGNDADTRVITADKAELDLKQGGKVTVGKLNVTDRTFYAIQAGVFTEEKSGQEAYSSLKKNDIPMLLFNDDVYRLFLGIGYQEQDAIHLSQFYKSLGTEIYLKKYTLKGGTITIPDASLAQMEVLNAFFTHGTYLLDKTAAWSGEALQGRVHITEDAWRKFKETHQAFLTEAKELHTFLPEEQKKWVEAMHTQMDKAVLAMAQFIEGQDREQIVTSQQGLLDYFDSYRSLLKSTGVDVVMR